MERELKTMLKVMIDPGHGGKDPGAVGNGLQEKNVVLTISKLIRDILVSEYEGVAVKLTRETDVFHELQDRAKMANDWGADYFLSVHINAAGGTGFESYIHQSQSAASAAAQAIIHAEIMKQIAGVRDRGKKLANFAVLKLTKMPAILTEVLFIDNASDAAKLKDSAFLEQVARGHAVGIAKALGLKQRQYEREDRLVLAVGKLQKAGVIGSPDYWLETARSGKQAKGENVASLIIKMAEKLG